MIRTAKILLAALAAITLTLSAANVLAQKDPEVGGAAMFPSKNIVQNAVNSPDHTTLVAAVKAGGLVDTLLKPENKDQLVKILTYHVVAGRITSKDLIKMIKQGGGKAELKTVSGGTLSASLNMGKVLLTDEKGGTATVTIADVYQSNGIIHVVDAVVLPN